MVNIFNKTTENEFTLGTIKLSLFTVKWELFHIFPVIPVLQEFF